MNSYHITAALAEQHRAQLLSDAQRHQQMRAANTGSPRQPEPIRRLRRIPWSLRPDPSTPHTPQPNRRTAPCP
jgi:hypothetical protein